MTQSKTIDPRALAVVGMYAAWPGGEGLEPLAQAIYTGALPPAVGARAAAHPEGLENAVRIACDDAGLGALAESKLGVVFTIDAQPEERGALSTAAGWIDFSDAANPLPAMLVQAQSLLAGDGVEAVVLAAAAAGRDADSMTTEPVGMGFDRSIHGWRPGTAVGAVVVQPYERALREGRRVYAVLHGAAAVDGGGDGGALLPPALADVRDCCAQALAQAQAEPGAVGYLEMYACGVDAVDGAEIAGVCQAYRGNPDVLSCAFGSVQSNLGHLGAAAGLFGLVRAALCLHERMLPVVPGWTAPKLPALWRGSPFYAPAQSSAWFARQDGPGRLAGLNVVGRAGSFAHLILGEAPAQRKYNRPGAALSNGGFWLIPLAAASLDELLDELNDLRASLTYATDLAALAAEWHAAAREGLQLPYGVAIVGHSAEELVREVELAINALPAVFAKQSEWQTPLGSCFAANPGGRMGQVAFVYPGAFNSYPWIGKDIFRLFPWLHERSVGRTVDVGQVIRALDLYPRSLAAPGKDELAAQEVQLLSNPVAMLSSGTTLAILFTYILQEGFQIQPSAAFGYSLGENSMMFATGVWQRGDDTAAALQASPLFHERLAGPQNAIREAWGLPSAPEGTQPPLWNNFLVMAPVNEVRAQVDAEPHVYITHINTPRQVVIAGDPQACQRVLAALRSPSLQAPFDYALHCDAIASEKAALRDLHDWPLERAPGIRLYTAANNRPMQLEPLAGQRHAVAEQIAEMLCSPLDFPRLVRSVYQDGARVFIEVGAGSNCARWVSESLKGEPHLALSVNRRGTDDYHSLVRLLAKLHSHRVSMDLTPLYQPVPAEVSL